MSFQGGGAENTHMWGEGREVESSSMLLVPRCNDVENDVSSSMDGGVPESSDAAGRCIHLPAIMTWN
jgi:hypothetical protein